MTRGTIGREAPLHVFFVHSHITLICAIGVIRSEGLKNDDVRMVFLRGYVQETPFSGFVFPLPASRDSPNAMFVANISHVVMARSRLKRLDEFVWKVVGNRPIHFYFPQTRRDFYHLLITHPQCTHFSIIEEGSTSYALSNGYARRDAEGLGERVKLALKRFAFPLMFGARGRSKGEFEQTFAFIGRGASRYYALSDKTYPDAPRRKILDLRATCRLASDLFEVPDLPDQSLILVLGDLIFPTEAGWERYVRTVQGLIETAASAGISHVAYKHHPTLSLRRDVIEDAIQSAARRHGATTSELSPAVCLELLAVQNSRLVFAGRSSASLYAKALGAHVLEDA